MIEKLEIRNFKSIQHLNLDCRRINLFIGHPNSGKSNLLEALALFSLPYSSIDRFVRFDTLYNLFYDFNVKEEIQVKADSALCTVKHEEERFIVSSRSEEKPELDFKAVLDKKGEGIQARSGPSPVKFYRYKSREKFTDENPGFLLPPDGENLIAALLANKHLREIVADIFQDFGYKFRMERPEGKIKFIKEFDDASEISFPYNLAPDTVQRLVFHMAAVESNRYSAILLEEPEVHSSPIYIKDLCELIAFSETNQFFISTHNPGVLFPLLEKTPQDELNIFVMYFKDYRTGLYLLNEDEKTELFDLGSSVFFDMDRYLEDV